MSEQWSWKRLATGEITQSTAGKATVEELFASSSFKLPVRDVSSVGYVPVRVVRKDGKWIEEDKKEHIWRSIVEFSSR